MATLQLVEPAYWHLAESFRTEGPAVADLCDGASYSPDGEQRMLLDGIFAKTAAGKSVAFAIAILACRQNIKTSTEKMAALGWLFLFHIDPIIWTSHEWDQVTESFRGLDEIIAGSPYLSRQMRSINRAQRDMEIVTRRGGRMLFKTRTPGGGRGLTGEKVILDEAWKLRATHVGSLTPTMSARSITGDPQIVYGSSAAHEDSEVLHPLIERGRAAATDPRAALLERRLMFAEWCAPPPEIACDRGSRCTHDLDTPGCGCDKPEFIRMGNPALDRRIDLEFIQTAERRDMPPHEFGRERMGWHDKPPGQGQVIPLLEWAAGLDAKSNPGSTFALSVVYTWDKKRAAIGLAGRRPRDHGWHVEIADLLDTTALLPRLKAIIAKARKRGRTCCGIAVDRGAFEAECIPSLERAHLPVVRMGTAEVAAAYSGFYNSVMAGHDLFHRGQDDLTLALMGASTRTVGDAGEAWGRRISGIEIAPIVAVTNARWLHDREAPDEVSEPGAWAL
jgi:hypothetical protein